jgi:chloramphenicol-sensitive protein RarD
MHDDHLQRERMLGVLSGLGAYGIWGFFPMFWKTLGHVPAFEVLAHRIVWACLLLGLAVVAMRRRRPLLQALSSRRVVGTLALTTLLIAANWLVFIWAVNSGRVLETSLGYFINPLVNVLLGVVFLKERLRPWQMAAVGLAAAGVLVLTAAQGTAPWASLVLGFTFGFYGLLRKRCPVDGIVGLTIETALLAPFAAAWLLWLGGDGAFGRDGATDLLLIVGGLLTTLPLLLFVAAAHRLRLATVGLLQYIAPTLHFILAVALYGEPLTAAHLVTFACIWGGIALYVGDTVRASSRQPRPA